MSVSLRNNLAAAAFGVLMVGIPAQAWEKSGGHAPAPHPAPDTCRERCGPAPGTVVHTPRVRIPAPTVGIGIPEINTPNTFVFGGSGGGGGFSSLIVAGGGRNMNTVIVGGGGGGLDVGLGGGFFQQVGGLSVEGEVTEEVTQCIPRERREVVEQAIAIRAVCLDNSNMPHPASRTSPDDLVAPGSAGELFRCMAGTFMSVTVGQVINGEPVFDNAQSRTCEKGEALRVLTDGKITCSKQEARRDCNERSLLRKYGPGVKIIQTKAVQTQKYCENVTREVTRQDVATTSPIVFDGGVGGY